MTDLQSVIAALESVALDHENRIRYLTEKPVIDSYLSTEVVELCSIIINLIDCVKELEKRVVSLERGTPRGPNTNTQ